MTDAYTRCRYCGVTRGLLRLTDPELEGLIWVCYDCLDEVGRAQNDESVSDE